MAFMVGQKVVCVNAKGGFINLRGDVIDSHELTEGAIYTIRSIGMSGQGNLAVRLQEITRRKLAFGYKPAPDNCWDEPFRADRFRPIVDTDISIFTRMLNPQSERA